MENSDLLTLSGLVDHSTGEKIEEFLEKLGAYFDIWVFASVGIFVSLLLIINILYQQRFIFSLKSKKTLKIRDDIQKILRYSIIYFSSLLVWKLDEIIRFFVIGIQFYIIWRLYKEIQSMVWKNQKELKKINQTSA